MRRCFLRFFDLPVRGDASGNGQPRICRNRDHPRDCSARIDVAVGIIDVKSYYIETPADVAERVRLCLKHAPAEQLLVRARLRTEPDGALGGAAEIDNMVSGVAMVQKELGLS